LKLLLLSHEPPQSCEAPRYWHLQTNATRCMATVAFHDLHHLLAQCLCSSCYVHL
jgi:hypothetical protein